MQRHWVLSFIGLVIVLATSPTYAQKPIYGGTLTIAQAVEPPWAGSSLQSVYRDPAGFVQQCLGGFGKDRSDWEDHSSTRKGI